jgi:hypothetical protein
MSELPLAALARIPGLLIRLGFSALRFKRRAIKSARKMRKGMVKAGMDRKMARELSLAYEEAFSVRRLISQAAGGDGGLSSIIPFGR